MPQFIKSFPNKVCEFCGKEFNRKKFTRMLEAADLYLKRRFCSKACANSDKEPKNREAYGKRARKLVNMESCSNCGTADNLQVHHIDENWKNNDISNLQVLCGSCHMKMHWAKWKVVNTRKKKYTMTKKDRKPFKRAKKIAVANYFNNECQIK